MPRSELLSMCSRAYERWYRWQQAPPSHMAIPQSRRFKASFPLQRHRHALIVTYCQVCKTYRALPHYRRAGKPQYSAKRHTLTTALHLIRQFRPKYRRRFNGICGCLHSANAQLARCFSCCQAAASRATTSQGLTLRCSAFDIPTRQSWIFSHYISNLSRQSKWHIHSLFADKTIWELPFILADIDYSK